jgi:hypothetical protein
MPQKIFQASTLALLISTLFSLWMFFGEPSVNTDGVIYLNTAKAFLTGGFSGALNVYGWPFYSILIAWVSKLGFSLAQSAALLNILFFAALAWAFVAAAELLYPGRRAVHYLAAAVILGEPYINSLRDSFFRDSGQLAFTLLSLVALLRHMNRSRPLTLIGWFVAVIAATLFRPEAALLLPAGILAIGVNSGRKRATLLWLALLLVAAAISVLLLQHYAPTSRVRDLFTWANYYFSEFGTTFSSKATTLETSVLGEFSNNGTEALIAALLVTFAAALIGVLTPIHALILWLQRKRHTGIALNHRRIFVAYAIAAVVPPAVFLAYAYFVSQRYILAFALLLLLLVPPRLLDAIRDIRWRPLRIGAAVVLILFFAISCYRNLKIESELRDAGVWLARQSGSVWTNSLSVSYYVESGDSGKAVTTQNRSLADADLNQINADWVALVVAKRDEAKIPALLQQLHGVERRRFTGGGRFVLVIKR